MKLLPETFPAHYARWLRLVDAAAQAAACQRWEGEGGSVRSAADAAGPKLPL